jgi:hypothetical protein
LHLWSHRRRPTARSSPASSRTRNCTALGTQQVEARGPVQRRVSQRGLRRRGKTYPRIPGRRRQPCRRQKVLSLIVAATLTVLFIGISRFDAVEVPPKTCESLTVASADAETCRFELTTPPFRLSSRTFLKRGGALPRFRPFSVGRVQPFKSLNFWTN